jgi:hypothetical protein
MTDIKFDLRKFRDVWKAIVYGTRRQLSLNTVGTPVGYLFLLSAGFLREPAKLGWLISYGNTHGSSYPRFGSYFSAILGSTISTEYRILYHVLVE